MRLPLTPPGGPPDGPPPREAVPSRSDEAAHPLFGGWSATRWQYTSLTRPDRVADVVCDLGGSVMLSLTATAYILAFDLAGRGMHSVSGACGVRGEELVLLRDGASNPDVVRFHQVGDTLSLHSEASGWDFDGSGQDQDAAFVAVLVRL